jgi:hypothetical protein
VLALRIDAERAATAAIRKQIASDILPRMLEEPAVVAGHLLATEVDASHVDTAESRTRAFDVPACVILIEATTAAAAERARAAFDDQALAALGATIRPDGAVYALEICRLSGWVDALGEAAQ